MDDNDIPPVMRVEPSSPNGHSPYADGHYTPPPLSRALAAGMTEDAYAPHRRQPDYAALAKYHYTRKQVYKDRMVFWQIISGALAVCVVILLIFYFLHVQVVYGAPPPPPPPGGQP